MRKSYFIAAAILAAAVGWIGSGVLVADDTPEQPQATAADAARAAEEQPLQRVRVTPSTAHERIDVLRVSGRTAADRTVQVRAETGGQVVELLKSKGDRVTAGDLIARIAMDDREARLAKARANLAQREIQFEAARDLQQRNFASRVRLAEARAALEEARADLAEIELDVDRTTIEAPIDGIIAGQSVEVGDTVSPGGAVVTLVDLDPLVVSADVAERRIAEIEPGALAHAAIFNGPELDGTVTFVAPVADPATRTFTVEVEIPNPDMTLREGQTAELRLPLRHVMAHEVSPALLTLDDEGRIGVKTVDAENTVRFHEVDMAAAQPNAIWLTGLPPEVRIITVGQEFVGVGDRVEPVAQPLPGGAAAPASAPAPAGAAAPPVKADAAGTGTDKAAEAAPSSQASLPDDVTAGAAPADAAAGPGNGATLQ